MNKTLSTWVELDLGDLGYREVEVEYSIEFDKYGDEPEMEIWHVWFHDVDVFSLLMKDALNKLECKVYELALEYQTNLAVDQAEARYEAWRDSQYD